MVELANKWMRRHPRLVSGSGISALATALLLIVGCVLVVRSERLARYDAQTVWHTFQQQRLAAQLKLTRASLADAKEVTGAIEACDQALATFAANHHSKWMQSKTVQRLDLSQQKQLAQDIAELHFLKATSLGLKAEVIGSREEHVELLTAARTSNQQAKSLTHDVAFSDALQRQKQWLQHEPFDTSLQTEATDLSQAPIRVLCERACLLSAEHRFGESIAWWDAAAMREPQNLWVWYGLGFALQQTKQYARAAECYSVCIAFDRRLVSGTLIGVSFV